MSKHTPKPHRFNFRSLDRATIMIIEPGFGKITEQEDKGCTSERLREAIKAAREAYSAVMREEHYP